MLAHDGQSLELQEGVGRGGQALAVALRRTEAGPGLLEERIVPAEQERGHGEAEVLLGLVPS